MLGNHARGLDAYTTVQAQGSRLDIYLDSRKAVHVLRDRGRARHCPWKAKAPLHASRRRVRLRALKPIGATALYKSPSAPRLKVDGTVSQANEDAGGVDIELDAGRTYTARIR